MEKNKEIVKTDERNIEKSTELYDVTPLVDIYENDEEILLHADMPGVKKDEININIDNGKLEITGIRKLQTTGATGWEEFGDVEFQRVFSIPQTIEIGKVNAE